MRAILNGLLYDTTASTVLYSDGAECLFKTVNDAYFKTDSAGITPMTEAETKEYLGIRDVDTYIKEFGTVANA